MKTKIGILTVSLVLFFFIGQAKETGAALISGQSLTELGQYSIYDAPQSLIIGAEALKTYELKYSNCDTPVLVGVKKTKKCMNFIVRTNNFEVEYVCNKHVFGVKRIDKGYRTVDLATIDQLMDNADFYTQRVISQNPKTVEELLGLIACYFPALIKQGMLSEI